MPDARLPTAPAAPVAPARARPATRPGFHTRLLGIAGARSVRSVSKKRKAAALAIAMLADLTQMVLWPAFAAGAASPIDDALDAVVALALLLTLGFSWRLTLALALELTPGADLFPTWSAVVATIPVHEDAEKTLVETQSAVPSRAG